MMTPKQIAKQVARKLNPPLSDWALADGRTIKLITPEEFVALPPNTDLVCIDGRKVTKGVHHIDNDTRGGYLAYGILLYR